MDIFSIIFFISLVVSGVLYLADRKGWNATAKRLTTIVRANLESGKPVKAIDKVAVTKELDKWTAEFEGKQIESGLKHEIVRTWYARVGGTIYPHYKCKCGHSDWHLNIDAADKKSKEHVKNQNHAEVLLARNGGTRAW